MFDKLKTLEDFRSKTKKSFEVMFNIIESSFRNIILINSNTPFISSWIVTQLEKRNLEVTQIAYSELIKYTSIGGYLRYELFEDNNRILLMDFFGFSSNSDHEISDHEISEIANEININRDLFTKQYNSIILLTPPNLTFAIKSCAIDFTSCVDFYIDTTKWWCSPNTLPLIKIRTYTSTTQHIIKAFDANPSEYEQFVEIKNDISNILSYTHESYLKIINKINNLSECVYYYELLFLFINKITQIMAKPKLHIQRIKDLKSMMFRDDISFQSLDIQLILAEFFYRSCEYDEAIARYRVVLQALREKLSDPYEENIFAFLQCNIVVCVYMKNGLHAPTKLLEDLKLRLHQGDINSSYTYDGFTKTYLFLISSACRHHTYIQHQEIFAKLLELNFQNPPMCSLTDEFDQIFLWESFINSQIRVLPHIISSNYINLSYKIQKMIFEFCSGNYSVAHLLYKETNRIAKGYGYMQLSDFLEKFQKNMHYLYTKN